MCVCLRILKLQYCDALGNGLSMQDVCSAAPLSDFPHIFLAPHIAAHADVVFNQHLHGPPSSTIQVLVWVFERVPPSTCFTPDLRLGACYYAPALSPFYFLRTRCLLLLYL